MISRLKKLQKYNLILATKSPRRQMLMSGMDLHFEIKVKSIAESYPIDMPFDKVPEYLAKLKAEACNRDSLKKKDIYITADTIVVLNDEVIGKPKNKTQAKKIIKALSGQKHTVITGVCLTSSNKQHSFSSKSDVYFRELEDADIDYYVEEYMPLDKAGAYGIQEWIGYIGIKKIEGSFYNVMGLPTQMLYEELFSFIDS